MRTPKLRSWPATARVLAAGMLIALLGAPQVGCTTNPATGRRTLMLLSRAEEEQIGAEAAPQFTAEYGGRVESPVLSAYVAGIGRKMAAETEAYFPTLQWEFTLLNHEVVNAFALPGGKVFISRGLAERLTSEAQMAGVLGHEIGHVTAQHTNQRISNQLLFNVGLAVGAVVVDASGNDRAQEVGAYGIPALAIGGNLVLLKFGRDEELEADRLGMRYMSNVGYDPRGQLEVMQVLAGLSQGDRPPEFLSTHPYPERRVEQIQKLLASDYAATQGNANYKAYAAEYRAKFLNELAKIPPPPKQQGALPVSPTPVDVAQAGTWCALCAGPGPARGMLAAATMASAPSP